MKFYFTKVVFILVLFNASSCKKEKVDTNKLPVETQEGKNTFGCIVDGSVWLPGKRIFAEAYPFYAEIKNNYLEISGNKRTDSESSIIIRILDFKGAETYVFDGVKRTAEYLDYSFNCYYKYDPNINIGTIEFTKFDTVQRIISGRFNFTAGIYWQSSTECKQTVNLTEGRFDIIY